MFPEAPYAAARRAMQSAQSRGRIHRVVIDLDAEDPQDRVLLYTRRRSQQDWRLIRAFAGWHAPFQSFFNLSRANFFTMTFREMPRLTLRPFPAPDEGAIAAAQAATRRLEILAMRAALAESGPSLRKLAFSIGVEHPHELQGAKPLFSFRVGLPGAERPSEELAGPLQRWWKDVKAWRDGIASFKAWAEFEIRSMHEALALLAAEKKAP